MPVKLGKWQCVYDPDTGLDPMKYYELSKEKPQKNKKKKGSDNKIWIRFIDSNHCIGSAMVHIKGPGGDILHTGHFRYNGEYMLKHIKDSAEFQFETIYMDNTVMMRPKQDVCRSQHEEFKAIAKQFEDLLVADQRNKFYVYCKILGKEEVLINLAKYFHTRVMIPKERYNNFVLLGLDDTYFSFEGEEQHNLKL